MALVEVRNRGQTRTKLSDTSLLESIFPQSPALPGAYQGTYNDQSVATAHRTLVDGIQNQNPDVTVDLDFGDAPDVTTLSPSDGSPTAIGNQAPAIGSPGAGSLNPLDIPTPTDPYRNSSETNGKLTVPAVTSPQIATQIGGGPNKNLGAGESGIQI